MEFCLFVTFYLTLFLLAGYLSIHLLPAACVCGGRGAAATATRHQPLCPPGRHPDQRVSLARPPPSLARSLAACLPLLPPLPKYLRTHADDPLLCAVGEP